MAAPVVTETTGRVPAGVEDGMRIRALAVVILGGLLATGCFVSVTHVSNPSAAFDEARRGGGAVPGRPGPARSLNVLVYDPGDRELVRVSLPMWLVREARARGGLGRRRAGTTRAGTRSGTRCAGSVSLRDLEKAALGTLVEVEEEDGEQVLVWLR